MPPNAPRDEPTCWFALAGEDEGHRLVAVRLTDRVLEARIAWFLPETRDQLRRWRGPTDPDPYWRLKRAVDGARKLGLPTHGHFSDGPGKPEAGMIRAQLLLWKHAHARGRRIDVGFIVRDSDDKERFAGARQAARDGAWPFKIVFAYPQPEVEAWRVAGFFATTNGEHARVTELVSKLGFSPIERPERLSSTIPNADTDAKKILDHLTADDHDRKLACLEVDLDLLRRRGAACGLADFLEAVEAEVVPLFGSEV